MSESMLGLVGLIISLSSQYSFAIPVIDETASYLYAQHIDITTDSSFMKYVGPNDPLTTPRYKPQDLVDLTDAAFGYVQGGVGQLRQEAFYELANMAFEFYRVFRRPLIVVSSYRSYGLQAALFEGYTESHGLSAAASFSALPGRSEHQLGLAVDLFTANDVDAKGYAGYYDWMRKNAHKWGWTQSYQKGPKTDGYIVEPWHWRYVGRSLATELYRKKMTFSERVKRYKKLEFLQMKK